MKCESCRGNSAKLIECFKSDLGEQIKMIEHYVIVKKYECTSCNAIFHIYSPATKEQARFVNIDWPKILKKRLKVLTMLVKADATVGLLPNFKN